jgi:hypothetical protein
MEKEPKSSLLRTEKVETIKYNILKVVKAQDKDQP